MFDFDGGIGNIKANNLLDGSWCRKRWSVHFDSMPHQVKSPLSKYVVSSHMLMRCSLYAVNN